MNPKTVSSESKSKINVLLISPRLPASHNKYCGDDAYTDTLIQYPPPNVCYFHYEDLILKGQARKISNLYRIGPRLVKLNILPPDLWAEYITSDFIPDLVHIYGFSAVIHFTKHKQTIPLVIGNGTASYSELKFYYGWEENQIHRARFFKRQYLKLIGAHDSSLRPEYAKKVHVWSEFSKTMHIEEGHIDPEKIEVIYPGLPWLGEKHQRITNDDITFLFVGSNFERKNGRFVVDAFNQLRKRYQNIKLIIVGNPADGSTINLPGITHYKFLPRMRLFESIYPSADVLILPSKAEGFGLVMLEAMSFGMPVIAVDAWAMKEIIVDAGNGFLIKQDSLFSLMDCMENFLKQPDLIFKMRCKSEEVFKDKFSIEGHNKKLQKLYDQSLTS